ncbi:quinone-dependent dihydroorotate dehydrogenase [Arthrobacter agilis]|uniref:quinone-dependent dihydroorotate dehydrogenase n=1 Tax=Arthrobacter agilis TaxID=37921 RepID=UPI000B350834|nr:quinone-dependent dihydroorotate dehydrogenase [Arthrobacter agilis]OUM45201.1 dihydroorotate dehydrogenase (quinone) [Arthrobacter agilis]PPB47536.1 quinone-dependent dihydroorotate dehydrogenase [Arthrobacter agilis]TPV21687.1 quinone-dependent dihydroorotate dehydrogenase [Arthrobacter agilis]VDR32132.1 Dihydroorotate dehydrogenase (quinone) [Arthrobacter agilis]
MRIYPTFFRIVFSGMDAERAHRIGFALIRAADRTPVGWALRRFCAPHPALATSAFGVDFPSPFGLAAGFDKAGTGVLALTALGFGHVEIGTVTGQAQPGNPRPRLFRLVEDRAVINRMGFNNDGAAAVAPRLESARLGLAKRYGSRGRPVVGVNIGKTKKVDLTDAIGDYLVSAERLAPTADYLVVNVSSPNTPGLRLLQSVESLRPLLEAVRRTADAAAGRHVPLLVKIAPDLMDQDIDDVGALALDLGLDGIVATNTTITRQNLRTDPSDVMAKGVGGLSGAPLKARSLEVVKRLRAAVGDELAIIAVGGVETPDDVLERLDAGATLVQGYTAFLYEGPFWSRRINRGLLRAQRTAAA